MIPPLKGDQRLTADDSLLNGTDIESTLSNAYVYAIAAHAGYNCGEAPLPDRDSVDLQVWAGGAMRPKIDIQLKATINLAATAEGFSFPLKIKNYNDLRIPTQTPRILVVLDLPNDPDQWLTATADQLVIQRCAYWASLRDAEETTNTSTVNIRIPRENVFDVVTLKRLMDMSRRGKIE